MTDTQFEVIGLINCDCCEEKSRGRSQPVTALHKNSIILLFSLSSAIFLVMDTDHRFTCFTSTGKIL